MVFSLDLEAFTIATKAVIRSNLNLELILRLNLPLNVKKTFAEACLS